MSATLEDAAECHFKVIGYLDRDLTEEELKDLDEQRKAVARDVKRARNHVVILQ